MLTFVDDEDFALFPSVPSGHLVEDLPKELVWVSLAQTDASPSVQSAASDVGSGDAGRLEMKDRLMRHDIR